MPQNPNNLIWIDLEMTGLDTASDYVIEIATIVTDAELNIIDEGPVLAIHQSEDILRGMDGWNQETHGKSGLIERVRNSPLTEVDAERMTIDFLAKHVPPNKSPMCGNSICQDRRFLYRCMPDLERYFHYRNLDVSTLKELARRWAPGVAAGFIKEPVHLAMEDIRDSIRELRFYREHMFKQPTPAS